jgi:2-iminoacetate synthase
MTTMELSRHGADFIDDARIESLLRRAPVDALQIRDIIEKALGKVPLTVKETAWLLCAKSPELRASVMTAARELKRQVYGNRIVLFAPLYVGNRCVNNCIYCGFRRENMAVMRRSLDAGALREEVVALERQGHKRLILVFGEHPEYSPEFIADCVSTVYDVRVGNGSIRRVNINAAPLDRAGFQTVKDAGVGTYQIFMESYHHSTYARVHPRGTAKADYLWRLDALSRALTAGLDDMGIGALFGLGDWRFEVLGLVSHARFLDEHFGCGPHTISFPRLRPAHGVALQECVPVSDDDFKFLIAVLRLAVPYTGLILTAREPAEIRREAIELGVSQIDAGSRIDLGGYGDGSARQRADREQFVLGDERSLDEVIRELLEQQHVPSFCTACYRLGRTGEHFMEFAKPGFIKNFCTPNALTTLLEYLVDYATPETRALGMDQIESELCQLPEGSLKTTLMGRLKRIHTTTDRDLYF